jgi:two-component system, chemotaxis family, sensor kinase CheA
MRKNLLGVPMDFNRNAAKECFLAEAAESLSRMEQALLELEALPEDTECLHTIFRVVHNLKGNAATLDFPDVAEFAHALEDLLDKLRDREIAVSADIITLLLQAGDALRALVPDAIGGKVGPTPIVAALLDQVNRMRNLDAPQKCSPAPSAPSSNSRVEPKSSVNSASLRVDIGKLDRMVNLTGEIAIARGRLSSALQQPGIPTQLLDLHREMDVLYSELQELVMRLRMVPLGPLFAQFTRTVRDIARSRGKLARLEISGEDVELDARVIELIRDPLVHLIRNAVDHGIEPPDARQAAGKDPCGVIGLHAGHEGGNVVVRVCDDGAGLDRKSILNRARQLQLVGENEQPADHDLYRLVFEAGFSTVTEVTELSGRGVGMDVVRRNLDALRGAVSLDSQAGLGTTVSMRIPLTLAIIDGFAVHVGDEEYVIPLDCVLECFEMRDDQHGYWAGGVVQLRGEPLPYIRLRSAFEIDEARPSREHIVVVHDEAGRFGLAVDSLDGEIQAVVKPLGQTFSSATDFFSSTILGNGRVALLIDVSRLAQRVTKLQLCMGGVGSEKR